MITAVRRALELLRKTGQWWKRYPCRTPLTLPCLLRDCRLKLLQTWAVSAGSASACAAGAISRNVQRHAAGDLAPGAAPDHARHLPLKRRRRPSLLRRPEGARPDPAGLRKCWRFDLLAGRPRGPAFKLGSNGSAAGDTAPISALDTPWPVSSLSLPAAFRQTACPSGCN